MRFFDLDPDFEKTFDTPQVHYWIAYLRARSHTVAQRIYFTMKILNKVHACLNPAETAENIRYNVYQWAHEFQMFELSEEASAIVESTPNIDFKNTLASIGQFQKAYIAAVGEFSDRLYQAQQTKRKYKKVSYVASSADITTPRSGWENQFVINETEE